MQTPRLSWFGISLIVVGTAILLSRLDVVDFRWTTALWVLLGSFGAKKAVDGFTANRRGWLFWGTFLFLLSLVQALEAFDMLHLYHYIMLPVLLIILGCSFLMLFLHSPRVWNVLIPAVSLLGLGSAIMMVESGYLYRWDVIDAVENYWPIAFILFGISMLVKRQSIPKH